MFRKIIAAAVLLAMPVTAMAFGFGDPGLAKDTFKAVYDQTAERVSSPSIAVYQAANSKQRKTLANYYKLVVKNIETMRVLSIKPVATVTDKDLSTFGSAWVTVVYNSKVLCVQLGNRCTADYFAATN